MAMYSMQQKAGEEPGNKTIELYINDLPMSMKTIPHVHMLHMHQKYWHGCTNVG